MFSWWNIFFFQESDTWFVDVITGANVRHHSCTSARVPSLVMGSRENTLRRQQLPVNMAVDEVCLYPGTAYPGTQNNAVCPTYLKEKSHWHAPRRHNYQNGRERPLHIFGGNGVKLTVETHLVTVGTIITMVLIVIVIVILVARYIYIFLIFL